MEPKSKAPFVSPKRKSEEELQGSSKRQNRTNRETPQFFVSPKRKSAFEDGGSSNKRQNQSKMETPKFKKPLRPTQLPSFFDNDDEIDYDAKMPSPVKTPEECKRVGCPELPPPVPPPPIQRDKRTLDEENVKPEEEPARKKFKKGMFLG